MNKRLKKKLKKTQWKTFTVAIDTVNNGISLFIDGKIVLQMHDKNIFKEDGSLSCKVGFERY